MRVTKIGVVVTTLCGLFWFSFAHAREADTGKLRLDLETAVQIALSENPLVKVADMEIEKKEYAKKSAYGALLPQVDLIGQFQHTLKRQTMYLDTDMGSLFGGGSVDPGDFTPEELKIAEVLGKMMAPDPDSADDGIQVVRKNMWTGGVNVSLSCPRYGRTSR